MNSQRGVGGDVPIFGILRWARAAWLYGASDALRGRMGAPLPPGEREKAGRGQAAPREAVGEEGFESAGAEGRGMTWEQAIEYALSDQWHIEMTLANLGFVTRGVGDCEEARALHREGLSLFERLGDRRGVAWHLVSMAGIEVDKGRADHAAVLLGVAAAVLEALGSPLPPPQQREYDRTVEQTQALLGEEAFAAFFDQGRAMSLEHAVEYALEEAG